MTAATTPTYSDHLHDAVNEAVGFLHGTWDPLSQLERKTYNYSGWSDYNDLLTKALGAGTIAGPLLREEVPVPVQYDVPADMRVIAERANEVLEPLGRAFPERPDEHFLEFYTLVLNFTLKAERNV